MQDLPKISIQLPVEGRSLLPSGLGIPAPAHSPAPAPHGPALTPRPRPHTAPALHYLPGSSSVYSEILWPPGSSTGCWTAASRAKSMRPSMPPWWCITSGRRHMLVKRRMGTCPQQRGRREASLAATQETVSLTLPPEHSP
ncbi:hypothetical protein P4O66_022780 [Electrophorus voltai]|uniref:Uncharacterized protein n=1 Tax=Electrophorus voltai TaxID=2609070 RepID=A0AAD8ZL12_9TELE|nr:hypothetical protein P4O66_022780 [Electrophorus voltai]